jgi:hypothetical protein
MDRPSLLCLYDMQVSFCHERTWSRAARISELPAQPPYLSRKKTSLQVGGPAMDNTGAALFFDREYFERPLRSPSECRATVV